MTRTSATLSCGVTMICLMLAASGASAQVAYEPFDPPPSPYGYPVPGGFLQPDEVLGTSPSFQIHPYAYGDAPAVRVVQTCQYPDGWNVTDFSRDVNGTPGGLEHACRVPVGPRGLRRRY